MKINKKTKQILKYFALFITIIILLIVLISVTIGFFYGDKVAAFVIDELNKNIETKLEVKEVKFSALRKFPNASIELIEVSITSSSNFNKKQFNKEYTEKFITAGRIFLQFNIMDIFNENYKIKWLEIENAKINILTDSKNNINYHFWKENNSSSSNSFSLKLQHVDLTDCKLNYFDIYRSFSTQSEVKKLNLSGKFEQEAFNLSIETDLFINSLKYKKNTYVENKYASAELKLEQDSSKYKIKNVELELNELNFDFDALYNNNDETIKNHKVIQRHLNSEFKRNNPYYIPRNQIVPTE